MDRTRTGLQDTWPASEDSGGSGGGGGGGAGAVPRVAHEERYQVLGERARGGLGRVLEVRDRTLQRVVALKELLRRGETGEARFAREAFITAQLEHPSIVPIHDAGYSAEGAPFYVMKLVTGRTLAELVDERATLRERLALVPNVVAVADAVAYAHSRGIIHRDLKGANVLVGEFGETVVIDWGLAKRIDDPETADAPDLAHPAATALTVDGAILGTPDFMAPEQARGERLDARTDVYALGALLYFVLSHKTPFEEIEPHRLIEAVRAKTPRSVRSREAEIPADLGSIVDKSLSNDPALRYPTARELAADLRSFQHGGLVSAHRYTAVELFARGLRRHLGVAVATAIFLLAGAVALTVLAFREQTLRRAAEQARDRAAAEKSRADQQSMALLEQQGRDELEAGRPFRAAVLLSEAYKHDPQRLVLRSLLSEALRPLGAHRLALVGHTRDVPAAAYSPDGACVLTASDDRTARIWDARTGATLRVLGDHEAQIESVAFRFDGKVVVTAQGGRKPQLRTWDAESGALLARFDVPDVWRVVFTPDGRELVVGAHDGGLRIVDAASGAARFVSSQHKDRVSGIAFRAGTSDMAVASWDQTLSIWDWRAGKMRAVFTDHETPLTSVSYSQDGRYLLTAEIETHVRVRDAQTLVRLRELHLPREAVDTDAVFAPDARTVITGTHDGRVRIWHTSTGALLRLIDVQPEGQLFHIAVRPDGNEVATLGMAGSVHLWSLDADLDYRLLERDPILEAGVHPAMYVDHGASILIPRTDGLVRLMDATTGETRQSIHVTGSAYTIAPDATQSHVAVTSESVDSFPPKIWDMRTGALVASLEPNAKPITYGLAATPDGAAFVTGDYAGTVREWDAKTGALRATHAVTNVRISSMAVHPDGRTFAVATERGEILFVDRASGQVARTLKAHATWIQSLDFASGGALLLTVGRQDHTVKLWREPFETPIVFSGHTGNVMRATLSPDGRRLATAAVDETVRIWDASSGELLRVIHGPSHTAAFRPTGDELLTTGPRGYAVVWRVSLDDRTPSEVAAYVAARSPWRLVDGRLRLADAPRSASP